MISDSDDVAPPPTGNTTMLMNEIGGLQAPKVTFGDTPPATAPKGGKKIQKFDLDDLDDEEIAAPAPAVDEKAKQKAERAAGK